MEVATIDEASTPGRTDGQINTSIRFEEHGRAIPLTEEERAAKSQELLRMSEEMAAILDDPPGSDEESWRAMDESHPERPLFREYYAP